NMRRHRKEAGLDPAVLQKAVRAYHAAAEAGRKKAGLVGIVVDRERNVIRQTEGIHKHDRMVADAEQRDAIPFRTSRAGKPVAQRLPGRRKALAIGLEKRGCAERREG